MVSNWFSMICVGAILILTGIQLTQSDPRVLDVYQSYPSSLSKQVEYDYRYAIDDGSRSGVVSDRWEQRIGEFVKGAYSLLEPSGKVRTVNYEVDGKRGFHATVKTSYPANVLLSTQQLEKYHRVHPEPLVNIYTRKTSPPPVIQLYKDPLVVPPNYHAILAAHAEPLFRRPPTDQQTRANVESLNKNYYTSTSLQPPPPVFSSNYNQQKIPLFNRGAGNKQKGFFTF